MNNTLIIENNFFKNVELGKQFDTLGYVVLQWEDLNLINDLEKTIESYAYKLKEEEFFYSLLNLNPNEGQKLQSELKKLLKPVYESYFKHFTGRNESFLSKPGGHKHELFLHQDWTFTDITRYASGTLWIPLQDVTKENGCMTILPKSHRAFNQYISASFETARIRMDEVKNVLAIELKKGEMLLFNPLVFHGSFPNDTQNARNIVTTQIFHKDAPYHYYQKNADNKTKIFNLEEKEVVRNLMGLVKEDLAHLEIVGKKKVTFQSPNSAMLNSKMELL